MKLSEKLYEYSKDIWDEYLKHPFILEMAYKTLDVEKYKYYMIQDYLYIKDYIKIFADIILKSDNLNDIEFLIQNMSDLLEETLRVHIPYMKELGITEYEIKKSIPVKENTSYTHYMLFKSATENELSGFVLLLNCSWSYAYIAENIINNHPEAAKSGLYSRWFNSYNSHEYKKTNYSLINKVDILSEKIDSHDIEKLCKIFRRCSEYELYFWKMAYKYTKKKS